MGYLKSEISLNLEGYIKDVPCNVHTSSIDTPVNLSAFKAKLTVPKVVRIKYKWGGKEWTATSSTNYVPVGTNVYFRAVPYPDVAWPNGKPVWGRAAEPISHASSLQVRSPAIPVEEKQKKLEGQGAVAAAKFTIAVRKGVLLESHFIRC